MDAIHLIMQPMFSDLVAIEMITYVIIQVNLAFTLVVSNVLERRNIAPCPVGSRPMYRPDGQPRKCLPHQNSLCVNALPDQVNSKVYVILSNM